MNNRILLTVTKTQPVVGGGAFLHR